MATGSREEDDLPPLEDFSELIGQMRTLGDSEEKKASISGDQTDHHENEKSSTSSILNDPLKESAHTSKIKSDEGGEKQAGSDKTIKTCEGSGKCSLQTFGGFQKGFLNKKTKNDQSKSNLQKKKERKEGEIPTVRPKATVGDELRFPEVQEAMKTPSSLLQNTDWITDDLFKKLEDRPDLLKKLSDPRYSQALSQFSSNPQLGWQHLSGDQELQDFIKELCGVLGDHFTAMAGQENKDEVDNKGSKADEEQMAKILSDPETLNVLKDPWISKLVQNLKENPPEARRMLARSRPEVLPKIKKLVDAGILTFG